jgi:hypothetical protein
LAIAQLMRSAASLLTLTLLTACAADGLPPLPSEQVRAHFPPGGVINSIEIDALNRLPLRTAELVAPDGRTTSASYLHVAESPSVAFYQRRIGTPFEGNIFTIDSLGPIPAIVAGSPQGGAELLTMSSTASIPVPDEIEYRRDWRGYRIFLSFGDIAGEVERRVLPAPEPPPKG